MEEITKEKMKRFIYHMKIKNSCQNIKNKGWKASKNSGEKSAANMAKY